MPVVIGGGCAGSLATGRFLDLGGRHYHDLLLTMARAMGRTDVTSFGTDGTAHNVSWVRPLSDPLGGTSFAHGRHPVKMFEPVAPENAPEWVVQVVLVPALKLVQRLRHGVVLLLNLPWARPFLKPSYLFISWNSA